MQFWLTNSSTKYSNRAALSNLHIQYKYYISGIYRCYAYLTLLLDGCRIFNRYCFGYIFNATSLHQINAEYKALCV